MKKESSIIFSADMIKATLQRRMTEVRIPCRNRSSKWRLPYKNGDRIWVKEAFSDQFDNLPVIYRAGFDFSEYVKWKEPSRMPRELSRITLEVIDVRIERLQTIDSVSAMSSGIVNEYHEVGGRVLFAGFYNYQYNHTNGLEPYFVNPIDSYRSFWNSTYGRNFPWKSNPYVYLIKFKATI